MAELTFYPTLADGRILMDVSYDWNAVRGASVGTDVNYTANFLYLETFQPDVYLIYRIFFAFDTSALGNDAVISAARLEFEVEAPIFGGNPFVHVVKTSQASVDELVLEDYDQLEFVSGGSKEV